MAAMIVAHAPFRAAADAHFSPWHRRLGQPALAAGTIIRMDEHKRYDIAVSAVTQYLADQSDESAERYVFSYTITIRNVGSATAQLISRHWIIADARGQVQEVRGLGVVGAQPRLRPGESFEYTSGTSIATQVGTMRGAYQMVGEDGTRFDAAIPEFTLSVPRVLH